MTSVSPILSPIEVGGITSLEPYTVGRLLVG